MKISIKTNYWQLPEKEFKLNTATKNIRIVIILQLYWIYMLITANWWMKIASTLMLIPAYLSYFSYMKYQKEERNDGKEYNTIDKKSN